MIKPLSIIIIVSIGTACGTAWQAKHLAAHRSSLESVLGADSSPEQKLDTLSTSFVMLMDEALKIPNPKKGMDYIERYTDENQKHVDVLLKEISDWQQNMNLVEKVAFGVRIMQKPYAKDFADLLPRFERKYKQVKFASRFSKRLRESLINAGMEELKM